MAAVTICSDFVAQKNKAWHCFHCFPIYLPWSDGTGCYDLVFQVLSFKPTFSLSSIQHILFLFCFTQCNYFEIHLCRCLNKERCYSNWEWWQAWDLEVIFIFSQSAKTSGSILSRRNSKSKGKHSHSCVCVCVCVHACVGDEGESSTSGWP